MSTRLFVLCLLCLGCGVPEPETPAAKTRAQILGGTATTGDLNVFMLEIAGNNGVNTSCTATLIAPRTLVTAAHCVDPAMSGATSLTIIASNLPTATQMIPGVNTVRVVDTRLHPGWNAALAGLRDDLALCLLETAQTVAVSPWNREPLTGLGGEAVRLVGYGSDVPDGGMGTKRTVDLTIRQFTAELISLGNFVDKGICHGDSGGPTFHTFGDGVERLVGVHSFTRTDECVDGADTRIDAKAPFILQWLSEKEENCGANFVCAVGVCLPNDPDCVAMGSPCEGAWECQGRECITDPQHPAAYCSRCCVVDGDCPSGLSCDVARQVCQLAQLPPVRPGEPCTLGESFCLSGSVCNGAGAQAARCSQPCARSADCLPGQLCGPGFSGTNACLEPPPITIPVARIELPAAKGCNTAGGVLPGLAFALLLFRRRVKNR